MPPNSTKLQAEEPGRPCQKRHIEKLKQLQSTPLRKRRPPALKHATSSAATDTHQPAIALRHVW